MVNGDVQWRILSGGKDEGRTQILVRLKDGTLFEIDGATEAPAGVSRAISIPEAERQGYAVAPIPGNLAALDLKSRPDNAGVFEYACHEGNHGMSNMLSAARWLERTAR